MEYEVAKTNVKGAIGIKRKAAEEVSVGDLRSVCKSQRLVETKSPRGQGQDDVVMINLDKDCVSSGYTAVDFSHLSTSSLLHNIQESLSFLHSRIQGGEARVAMVDLQQEQVLAAIKKGEAVVREKSDVVVASFAFPQPLILFLFPLIYQTIIL